MCNLNCHLNNIELHIVHLFAIAQKQIISLQALTENRVINTKTCFLCFLQPTCYCYLKLQRRVKQYYRLHSQI